MSILVAQFFIVWKREHIQHFSLSLEVGEHVLSMTRLVFVKLLNYELLLFNSRCKLFHIDDTVIISKFTEQCNFDIA